MTVPTLPNGLYRSICRPWRRNVSNITNQSCARPNRGCAISHARGGEVLSLVADGLAAPAIAEHLGIAWSTVRTHVERCRTKLGARSCNVLLWAPKSPEVGARGGDREDGSGDAPREAQAHQVGAVAQDAVVAISDPRAGVSMPPGAAAVDPDLPCAGAARVGSWARPG